MNIFNLLPFLNGYKSFIGAAGVFLAGLAGLLTAVAAVATLAGSLLSGDVGVMEFVQKFPVALDSASTAFLALLGYGLAHKLEKLLRK
jgi:hypothetical protein